MPIGHAPSQPGASRNASERPSSCLDASARFMPSQTGRAALAKVQRFRAFRACRRSSSSAAFPPDHHRSVSRSPQLCPPLRALRFSLDSSGALPPPAQHVPPAASGPRARGLGRACRARTAARTGDVSSSARPDPLVSTMTGSTRSAPLPADGRPHVRHLSGAVMPILTASVRYREHRVV